MFHDLLVRGYNTYRIMKCFRPLQVNITWCHCRRRSWIRQLWLWYRFVDSSVIKYLLMSYINIEQCQCNVCYSSSVCLSVCFTVCQTYLYCTICHIRIRYTCGVESTEVSGSAYAMSCNVSPAKNRTQKLPTAILHCLVILPHMLIWKRERRWKNGCTFTSGKFYCTDNDFVGT